LEDFPAKAYIIVEDLVGEAISELRAQLIASREALRECNKRATAGQLALELMHEIRNPLEALGNLIFLARNDSQDPETVQYRLLLAEEQLATLNQLVGHTLGFARFSGHPKMINLVSIAEAALRMHQRAIDRKTIHLVKELPDSLTAEVYAVEMLQVISNLLMNAIDALPDKGVLFLRLRKRQDKIYFVIADNGHGIPPEHRKDIFKPFFTTKKDRGTGLGLALSMEIVERHRGKICMRSSVRPNKSGTTFRISLPG
jgi:signal transduction histidine kinase